MDSSQEKKGNTAIINYDGLWLMLQKKEFNCKRGIHLDNKYYTNTIILSIWKAHIYFHMNQEGKIITTV